MAFGSQWSWAEPSPAKPDCNGYFKFDTVRHSRVVLIQGEGKPVLPQGLERLEPGSFLLGSKKFNGLGLIGSDLLIETQIGPNAYRMVRGEYLGSKDAGWNEILIRETQTGEVIGVPLHLKENSEFFIWKSESISEENFMNQFNQQIPIGVRTREDLKLLNKDWIRRAFLVSINGKETLILGHGIFEEAGLDSFIVIENSSGKQKFLYNDVLWFTAKEISAELKPDFAIPNYNAFKEQGIDLFNHTYAEFGPTELTLKNLDQIGRNGIRQAFCVTNGNGNNLTRDTMIVVGFARVVREGGRVEIEVETSSGVFAFPIGEVLMFTQEHVGARMHEVRWE